MSVVVCCVLCVVCCVLCVVVVVVVAVVVFVRCHDCCLFSGLFGLFVRLLERSRWN